MASIMRCFTKTGSPADFTTDCLVAGRERALEVAESFDARALVEQCLAQAPENAPTVAALPGRIKTLLVPPVGREPVSEAKFRKCVSQAATALAALRVTSAVWCLNDIKVAGANGQRDAYWKTRTGLAALSTAAYRYHEQKSKAPKRRPLSRVNIHAGPGERNQVALAVRHGNALDAGLRFARDLANAPPNVCNPEWLAAQANTLAEHDGVTVETLDEAEMEALGMGAFLSVTRGSDAPAKLIVARYRGAGESDAPVVFVGKGVTFDTGGISLKPGAAMDEMKFDMCGAATVAGALKAAAVAELPINLIAILAAAENMPSGNASRPGDIVTTLSGKTVEILNTDAEGRLLLCDALTFAKRYKPAVVVDVATLTGACVIALGAHASAVFANDDALSAALLDAGATSGDRAWPMPLWEDYQAQLDSNFADVANIGGRPAGAITAACFLSRFAKGFKWAHMDVAGTAYRGGKAKGATGRPTPLLFQYLLDRVASPAAVPKRKAPQPR